MEDRLMPRRCTADAVVPGQAAPEASVPKWRAEINRGKWNYRRTRIICAESLNFFDVRELRDIGPFMRLRMACVHAP